MPFSHLKYDLKIHVTDRLPSDITMRHSNHSRPCIKLNDDKMAELHPVDNERVNIRWLQNLMDDKVFVGSFQFHYFQKEIKKYENFILRYKPFSSL